MSGHGFSGSDIDIATLHLAMPVTLQQSFYPLTVNPTCGRTCDTQINHSQIGHTSTRPINDQESLFHEKAVRDDSLGSPGFTGDSIS